MSRYHLHDHARMFGATARNDAYEAALRRTIAPGSVVLDVGTGCGLFAMLACRAGAARVYAVEVEPSVSLARELAAENGFAGRITFLQQSSTDLELPEPVDIVVADIRGVLPLAGGALAALIDVRERLLRPGGTMIPARDVIRGAIVSAPDVYARAVGVWSSGPQGLSAAAGRAAAVQQLIPVDATDVTLLSHPADWTAVDYRHATSASATGSLTWEAARGTAHGFALWFDAHLVEGIGYSSAPGSGDELYGVAFFPWTEAVALDSGVSVRVDVRADFIGESYVWTWRTAVDGARPRRFDQSTFRGGPIARDRLPPAAAAASRASASGRAHGR